jgi:ubiquinone/menaquinone biosynthesis C-methylase UbiE
VTGFLYRLRPQIGMSNRRNRETWVASTLARIPAGSRVLDAGAGEQPYRKHCQHLDYVAQDFAEYQPGVVSGGLHPDQFSYSGVDIVSDITSIPEPDASFDAILCVEVLEHVPDPVAAVHELARLVRPGGVLILTAPFCSLTHFAPFHFSTGFSRYWYQHHLPSLGLTVEELAANGTFFEYVGQELWRTPSIAARYAGTKVRRLEMVALYAAQAILARWARRDAGSAELLCYGYHVIARKMG